ncbi:hypothetical protein Y1Q_0008047 [Alligator mississippiensis]|uniref:Uncharacterized protein n=1 Tax=Alligator mississippiensis TaxID=8496 RepID=A0A151NFF1_ALLMI|nr:hypothetical protein Y1Q_0008047 [Alligator mississippiensis]
MPFYEELSHLLTMDRATEALNTYGTSWGWEKSSAGTPLEEETLGGPRTMEKLGVQDQIPKDPRIRGQFMVIDFEESVPLVLVPVSSQNVGAELHLQLDQSSLDIFSDIVKSREYGTQEQGGSSNSTEIETLDLETSTQDCITEECSNL